ncbi:MAG: NAD(P)/FAD-dependent oxidoreductase [Balneolaceae bacterium]
MIEKNSFDVIIVGGSYAGLSAAMTLGRSLKRTLVIDSGKPCNRQTPHSHNFLTRDGQSPEKISTIARAQVEQYEAVKFYDGFAVAGKKADDEFEIITRSNENFYGKKLIFATGITDEIPDIPGFSECWGISVIHCPYCHGHEHRGERTGILANGEQAFHLASLVNNLTEKLVLLTKGKSDFSAEQMSKLKKHDIQINEAEVTRLEQKHGQLKGVVLADGETIELNALYAGLSFSQHSDIPMSLGCKLTEQGYIEVDNMQKTTVPGIYACGDNSAPFRSIANAVQTGNVVGAVVNMDLTNEQF